MRNKKILYLLIPLIILVLVLIVGVVYLKINTSPEKIFKHSISKVFEEFKNAEKQNTMKGTMTLTTNVESENEQMKEINAILNGVSFNLDMGIDTGNMIINESLDATINNENLFNATIILQDQKGYVYLKDYLDKYLEIPQEDMGYLNLTEYNNKIQTLDQNKLITAIKDELIKLISAQQLAQEDTTINLDGKETKVTASILNLKGAEYVTCLRGFLETLKNNENFQTALGNYKEEFLETLNSISMIDMKADENVAFNFIIYTKGFLNEFVGVSLKILDETTYQANTELEVLKDNKGILFTASTDIKGATVSISGNLAKDEKNVDGNFMISVQEETFGKANLNCSYDFTYGVEIEKVDIQNSAGINSLSKDERTTFLKNIVDSKLYEVLSTISKYNVEGNTMNGNTLSVISNEQYVVSYDVPEEFELFEDTSSEEKMYMDENYNSVYLSIKKYSSASKYINDLEETYILSSSFYENQQISDVRTYKVNGKDYKIRTITYNDEYKTYVDLYFAYELNNEYCYVVQVSSESGNLSLESINKFLDIDVK